MRFLLIALVMTLALSVPAKQAAADDWPAVLEEARGETVYWHAWAGDARINAYIAWVGDRVAERYGVTLEHVKVQDTATVVAQVLAEKTAGRMTGGSVDLVWINGENFAAMKANDLLFGPFAQDLPNWSLVDVEGKPTTVVDFTVPTDGLEAPWGMAQFVFVHDTELMPDPPRTMAGLADWAAANPGRMTYPRPPDFIGSTFLKQALLALIEDRALLDQPVAEADFAAATAPLWAYLDALHPHLWRGGRVFPESGPALRTLLADGEVALSLSFHPAETSAHIAEGLLPETVRTFVLDSGTIGNTHFVAIPFNANASAAARVVANFLMSAEAQARKADPAFWGDATVLDLAKLPAEARALFEGIDLGPATLGPAELGAVLPEPHPSWMTEIEAEWERRYGAG